MLVFSAELQKVSAEPELRALRDHRARPAADDRPEHRAGNLAHGVRRRLGLLRRAVAKRDVAQLVRHDAGNLPFGVRPLHHPAVDEHRPARQREGVDLPKFTPVKLYRNSGCRNSGEWHRPDAGRSRSGTS